MALREILASFGFAIDESGLKKANAGIDGAVSKLTNLKGVIGGALAAFGLGEIKGQIDDLAGEVGEINKASIKAGVSFEQFEKISYVTGLSTEQLTTTFRNLQLGMAAAKGQASDTSDSLADLAAGGLDKIGKAKSAEGLKALKVGLTDAKGAAKSSADVFQDTITALARVKDPTDRAALATKVFGTQMGQTLLPLLQKSPEALAAAAEQFELLGGISEESRASLAAYGKEQKVLNLASNSLKVTILTALVPALTWLFQKVNEGILWFKKNADTTQLVTTGLIIAAAAATAFAVANGAAALAAIGAWIAVAAPIIVAYLLIDDLIHFIKGDANTAIGGLIVLIFGKQGESWIASVRKDAKDLYDDLVRIDGILGKIKEFTDVLGYGVSNAINAVAGLAPTTANGDSEGPRALRGVTRKSRRRAANALAEEGISTPTRPGVDLQNETGKTEDHLLGVTLAPVTLAGKAGTGAPVNVQSTTNVVQNITGDSAKDAADQSVAGIKKVQGQDLRGTWNAVVQRK